MRFAPQTSLPFRCPVVVSGGVGLFGNLVVAKAKRYGGSRLPGVPRSTFYAELKWRHAPSVFTAAFEYLHKGRVWVGDRNSEAAPAYGIYNLAASFVQQSGRWRFSEYLRVDNVGDKRYAGSVVVNDANLRFYEPAPGRNATVGIQVKRDF